MAIGAVDTLYTSFQIDFDCFTPVQERGSSTLRKNNNSLEERSFPNDVPIVVSLIRLCEVEVQSHDIIIETTSRM